MDLISHFIEFVISVLKMFMACLQIVQHEPPFSFVPSFFLNADPFNCRTQFLQFIFKIRIPSIDMR